ncbi:response regulator [Pseudomonas alloputida]|uniref:Response regulator n=1 Tax=Pseudomonas alloputida TaxID=1940621 RepID=A0AAW7HQ95_9PSED|nr:MULTISPECIES: response regulator [Pseudomonas]MCE0862934.1 response regulator [Pseudomonas alloputida]MCE0869728.1 response regulator [Pseudomonas alloputida]MCE0892768.1 response regulator [Pseudomonas alloputida]MCE0922013.1 response regulator [Pseudomonas alloputida]MCE1047746.1 response regulator [Pseudomonas alloputida]
MKKYLEKTILLADDEPTNLDWLIDFINHIGFNVEIALTASDAIQKIQTDDYRALIIDLNIPKGEGFHPQGNEPTLFKQYPGLHIARSARNNGNNQRRVIIYSVYQTEELAKEIEKFGCEYVSKQRPKLIKETIKSATDFDPKATSQN